MLLKYLGKRSYIANDFGHKRYVFNKANDFTCNVDVNIAKQLIVTGEYLPIAEKVEIKVEKIVEKKVAKPRKKFKR